MIITSNKDKKKIHIGIIITVQLESVSVSLTFYPVGTVKTGGWVANSNPGVTEIWKFYENFYL